MNWFNETDPINIDNWIANKQEESLFTAINTTVLGLLGDDYEYPTLELPGFMLGFFVLISMLVGIRKFLNSFVEWTVLICFLWAMGGRPIWEKFMYD